jgi:hypothetical protein
MKAFLLALLVVFCIGYQTSAQQYVAFPDETASWKVIRCFYFFPEGWYDVHTFTMSGDTTTNGISYKKIYETVHHLPGTQYDTIYTHYFGALREEGKKIMMISEWATGDSAERILYDFSAQQTGDWIYTNLLTYGEPVTVKSRVGEIDSIEIGGVFHRRIHIDNAEGNATGESWVEGLGSVFGLIYSGFYLVTDNSYDLRCFSTESVTFINNDLNLGFCISVPDVNCDFSTPVPGNYPELSFTVFPNPATGQLILTGNNPAAQIHSLKMYSITGQQVLDLIAADEMTMQIDVSSFPRGMYYLKLAMGGGHQSIIPIVLQ